MGYNTTVVVLNDALDLIASDPDFGRRLVAAISECRRGVSVAAHGTRGIHCNAALVVESHHADDDVLIRVGGNRGEVVPQP